MNPPLPSLRFNRINSSPNQAKFADPTTSIEILRSPHLAQPLIGAEFAIPLFVKINNSGMNDLAKTDKSLNKTIAPNEKNNNKESNNNNIPDFLASEEILLQNDTTNSAINDGPIATIAAHFAEIDDPRVDWNKSHELLDIIIIAICAVICGANNWIQIEEFGSSKREWLELFLELKSGIPSHDTFNRVFSRLDPKQFQNAFISWVQSIRKVINGEIIAVDGKTNRRTHDKKLGKNAIHMVSAWATSNNLVLGQVKVNEKSNEITAIPQLLDLLYISGCIVTIDAMGCQKDIAQKIIDKDADYVLALKKNQKNLYEDVQNIFQPILSPDKTEKIINYDYFNTVDINHGRVEIREGWTISGLDVQDKIRNRANWANLNTIALVRDERRIGDKIEISDRLFISSLPSNAEQILGAARAHWSIETSLHWVLDVAFREDDCRLRTGHGPENLAILRHMALNLLKQEKSSKHGIQTKRFKAGLNENYLLKVLSHGLSIE